MDTLENLKSVPSVLDGGSLPPKEAKSTSTEMPTPKSPFSATPRTLLQGDLEAEAEEEPYGTD